MYLSTSTLLQSTRIITTMVLLGFGVTPSAYAVADREPLIRGASLAGISQLTKRTVVPMDPIPSADIPDGMRGLHGVVVADSWTGKKVNLADRTIVTFRDGSYTYDLHTVFNKGADASRALHPSRWGSMRKQAGRLEFSSRTNDDFAPSRGQWSVFPAEGDQRLTGCYAKSMMGSSADRNAGKTVAKSDAWCFWSDGRFTHRSKDYGNGKTVAGNQSKPNQRGRYRIDGYAVRFTYDNGDNVQCAFSFLTSDRKHIALNGRRLQPMTQAQKVANQRGHFAAPGSIKKFGLH